LVSILQGNRDESKKVDHDKVKEDATQLYEAGEGRWGTDESAFNKVLVLRSAAHIKELKSVYANISSRSLEEALDSELSGEFLVACKTIVEALVNPVE